MHASLDPATIRPLRRVEYDKLVTEGVFANERVELLYGLVVRMTPINEPHCLAVDRLVEIFILALHGRAHVRCQGSFAASDDSQPEPDLAVYPLRRDERKRPSEARIIIEVSDSSLAHDRQIKAALYAEVGVPEYWIVNLVDRVIEVHRDPAKGVYSTKTLHARGDAITLLQFRDVTVRVSDVIR